jgi:hypothetical protein
MKDNKEEVQKKRKQKENTKEEVMIKEEKIHIKSTK